MDEKIKLSDILVLCLDFMKNPSEEQEHKIDEILGQLQVAEYMPLLNKQLSMVVIMNCATDIMDAAETEINIVAGKIFYGLFQYVTNLDVDIEYGYITPGIIDALYQLGVIDYILSFCAQDFARLEAMTVEALNFANIEKICRIPALLSNDKLDELINTIKDAKSSLTPEMLDNIRQISTETSPEWKNLKESLAEEIHDNIMDQAWNSIDDSKSMENK